MEKAVIKIGFIKGRIGKMTLDRKLESKTSHMNLFMRESVQKFKTLHQVCMSVYIFGLCTNI